MICRDGAGAFRWRLHHWHPTLRHLISPHLISQSQAQNKARALELLKARLLVVAQEQQLQEVAQIRGDLVKAGE